MKKTQNKTGTSFSEFKKELNSYQPKWWESYLFWPTERWYQDIKYLFKTKVPCYFQRARYGYSDEDVWSLDSYLCSVISGSVGKLRKHICGYPTEKGMTFKKWGKILKQIEDGFKEGDQVGDYTLPPTVQKKAERRFQNGAKLFIRYFFSLWN